MTIFFERIGLVLDVEYFCVVRKSGSFTNKAIIQSKVYDTLPRPHSIKFPFRCGYVLLIPDLCVEKDTPKKEAFENEGF